MNQKSISKALKVNNNLKGNDEVATDIKRRIQFLKDALRESGMSSLVLGVSGGVDSSVAGTLCQEAALELRKEGYQAEFHAVRLPYGTQADDEDAQAALTFIGPDKILTVDIKPSVDALCCMFGQLQVLDSHTDLIKGNIKARVRMTALYTHAGLSKGLVVGTDQAAEAVMGFSTKFGDAACDLAPLTGLTKGQVRRIASDLGLPLELVMKTPLADLEELSLGKTDEEAMGITYDQIDAFLLGEEVSSEVANLISAKYKSSIHKRQMPKSPH